ncbi:HCCA isomerase/glutathione S-transferase kappa [Trichocladium antarcticum]|uniref:Glutathione S-transferase kappa n=1 Tax=Trichocladium antarcticum TaxID=1450529 RepID=A0AAN6ZB26_9PEZI|nr:HCCA isomerase/glutathione S-transferase kappa [Trichocladium antarcticum]
MARPKITLYVDTVSPFAYEAYYLLRHDEVFKGCDVTYVPIFLGGLMHKCGNTAPIKIKNKDLWINTERLRWARAFNIPMTVPLPPDFPAPTLPVMRALCAVANSETTTTSQARLTEALDTLFAQYWVHAEPTHQPAVLRETLAGLWGADAAEEVLQASTTPETKQALLANTDQAFAAGAFGLPWMVCTDAHGKTEGFWGVDHLGQVVQFLGLRRGSAAGWRAAL